MKRTSKTQYLLMIDYMEKHGDLAKPSSHAHGKQIANKHWKELVRRLNGDPTGDTRNDTNWRKVWSDLKQYCKKKTGKIYKNVGGTGGGPAYSDHLTDLEQRVMQVVGIHAAIGMDVQEAGFEIQEEEACLLPDDDLEREALGFYSNIWQPDNQHPTTASSPTPASPPRLAPPPAPAPPPEPAPPSPVHNRRGGLATCSTSTHSKKRARKDSDPLIDRIESMEKNDRESLRLRAYELENERLRLENERMKLENDKIDRLLLERDRDRRYDVEMLKVKERMLEREAKEMHDKYEKERDEKDYELKKKALEYLKEFIKKKDD